MGIFQDWLDKQAAGLIEGSVDAGSKALDTFGDLAEKSGLVGRGLGRRVQDLGDYVEGNPEDQGVFERVLRKSTSDIFIRPQQHAFEAVGGAIGGTAAGIDQLVNPNPDNISRGGQAPVWDAIVAGAKEGGEQAKDVIEPIDALGLAAGGGASVLGKAAMARNLALPAARNTLAAAKILNTADAALTTGDALYGVSTLKEGLDEGDGGKTFEGLARVAGNAYGMKQAFGEFGSMAKTQKVLDIYKKFEAEGVKPHDVDLKLGDDLLSALAEADAAVSGEKLPVSVAAARARLPEVPKNHTRVYRVEGESAVEAGASGGIEGGNWFEKNLGAYVTENTKPSDITYIDMPNKVLDKLASDPNATEFQVPVEFLSNRKVLPHDVGGPPGLDVNGPSKFADDEALTPREAIEKHLNIARREPTNEELNHSLEMSARARELANNMEPGSYPRVAVIGDVKSESGHSLKLTMQRGLDAERPSYAKTAHRIRAAIEGDEDVSKSLTWILDLADSKGEEVVARIAAELGIDPSEALPTLGRAGFIEVTPGPDFTKPPGRTGIRSGGWTNPPEAKQTNLRWGNRYAINIKNQSDMAKSAHSKVMSPPKTSIERAEKLAAIPDRFRNYVESRWAGGEKNIETERELANALFVETLHYSPLHEGAGHAFKGSGHRDPRLGYYKGGEVPHPLWTGDEHELFDRIHNVMIKLRRQGFFSELDNIVNSPTALRKGGVIDRLRRAAEGSNPEYDKPIPRRSDRPVGPTKNTEADSVLAHQIDEGAHAEVERLGPDIETSVQDRLKAGLRRHQRGAEAQGLRNKELKAKQAEAVRNFHRETEGLQMTPEEIVAGERRAMELAARTVEQDPVAFTSQELSDLMREVDTGDVFRDADLKSGLLKLAQGEQLQPAEVGKLKAHFLAGDDSIERSALRAFADNVANALGMTRSLMASADLSAPGRQGLYASVMNPKEASRAFVDQIRAYFMGTKEEFDIYMKKLTDPRYNAYAKLSEAAGLHISHEYNPKPGNPFDPKRYQAEEQFSHTDLIEKAHGSNIPGLSHAAGIVKRSERAYLAYLNRLRVELFNKMADKMLLDKELGGLGMDEISDFQAFKDLAYMVNTLTGRGELNFGYISPASFIGQKTGLEKTFRPGSKILEPAHLLLTSGLFAPRFAASRASILRDATLGLALGGNLHPKVYKEYMRNVMGTAVTMASVMSALAAAGIGTLTWDPKRADFGQLKIGNTRYDPWGGLKPWVKLHFDLMRDDYISSTGRYHRYGDYGAKNKRDVITNFILSKQAPAAGLIMEAITGESPIGKKRPLYKGIAERYTPMIITNMYEIAEEEGMDQAVLSLPFVTLGGGTTTYNPYER